jgi:hypothetical protein
MKATEGAQLMQRPSINRVLPLAILTLFAPITWASDALSFFNNWFVTGDYAVAGVGLRGTGVNGIATGTINLSGVPAAAEPIAAFLYWSTIEYTAAPSATDGSFNGHKIRGVVVGNPQNSGCFSSGGDSGGFARVYRADVLRYLPVNPSNIRQANGNHTVSLPDSGGNGNGNLLYTNGASLVVIYRVIVPGNPAAAPLRSVVIYNGAFTMDKHSAGMTQNVPGFYEASASAAAMMTNIVANGQPGFSSSLFVNGTTLSNNSFVGAQGARWDNPTYAFSLAEEASSFSTLVTVGNNQTCLTSVAIIASMNVKDSDGDGLLDIWETKGLHRNTQVSPATFGTCSDYPAEPCLNLPAMGAALNKQDIFLQIDWMHGTGDGTGGTNGLGSHNHLPKLPALDAVANTFAARGINLHFDVGNYYQGSQSTCGNTPCSYIIPAMYAQGGTDIDESTLVCHDTATHSCAYHELYPVLSFEFGFASVRDGNRRANIAPHLEQNRRDVFRYTLFAHALAGPFDANGKPVDPVTLLPTTSPKSYSGIAQRPGGGLMVTLGLWRSDFAANDQVGSVLVQAGTLMHELGHTLSLSHGGLSTKPNCMPNYQSVMNYLYQTRGLTDSSGLSHIDYSDGQLSGLNENSISETVFLGPPKYRLRYYGPFNSAIDPPSAPAKLTCGGRAATGLPLMVRLENTFPNFIDFNHDGKLTAGTFSQDLNYDGVVGETFADQPDWTSLNLQQIAGGPNFGGLSVGAFATDGGVFATDGGAFATDAGALATDGGVFATDGGAFATDAGAFATDGGVFATDGGALATDGGAFATDAGELDFETVVLSTIEPPPPQTPSCPTCGLTATPKIDRITLSWTAPDIGHVASYNIYRSDPTHPTPALLGSVAGGVSALTYDDIANSTSTLYNTTYIYYITSVVLVDSQLNESLPSTTASGIVKHLFITADNKTRTYGDPNPALTATITGQDQSTLTGPPSCATTATTSSPVGNNYVIHCTATSTSSIDGISSMDGTLTINQKTVTPSITASNKTYDGTTRAVISCTVATKVGGDDVACVAGAADFASASPGTWAVNATAITLTGTTSGNYTLNGVTTASTTATINPATPVLPGNQNGNSTYGVQTMLSVTISAVSGGATPTGSVTFQFTLAGKTYNVCSDGSLQVQPAGTPCSVPVDGTGTAKVTNAILPAGSDNIIATYSGDKNYAVGEMTAINITVSQANTQMSLAITPNSPTPTYGDTLTLAAQVRDSSSGSAGTPTGTVQFAYSTDNLTWTSIGPTVTLDSTGRAQLSTTILPAGSPKVKASYSGDTNFIGSAVSVTQALNQKTLTVTGITAQDKNYDGTNTATLNTSGEALAGVVNSDDVHLSGVATGTFMGANVASGKTVTITGLTLTGMAVSNYMLTQPTGTATINPRPATVTADNKSKIYGTVNPALTATVTGTVNGDTLNYTLATTAGQFSGVNSYPITVTLGTNPNYTVTPANGTLTINKATTTVILSNMTQTYAGTPLSPTATITPAVSFSWTGAPQTNSGSYSVMATVTDPNYTGSASGTFTITKATLTVTADNQTRPEFQPNPPLTASYSGFVNGQTLGTSGITGSPNLTTTATLNSDEGTYLITVTFGTLTSGNYTFSFVNGTLTVTP